MPLSEYENHTNTRQDFFSLTLPEEKTLRFHLLLIAQALHAYVLSFHWLACACSKDVHTRGDAAGNEHVINQFSLLSLGI